MCIFYSNQSDSDYVLVFSMLAKVIIYKCGIKYERALILVVSRYNYYACVIVDGKTIFEKGM